jgi:hypothetical protein
MSVTASVIVAGDIDLLARREASHCGAGLAFAPECAMDRETGSWQRGWENSRTSLPVSTIGPAQDGFLDRSVTVVSTLPATAGPADQTSHTSDTGDGLRI